MGVTPERPLRRPPLFPTRALAAHALHARLGSTTRTPRAVRGFLGPTTIPYSTTKRPVRAWHPAECLAHTRRVAAGAGCMHPQAAEAGWMAELPRNLVWACGWLASVWCRVGAHAMLVAFESFCGDHLSANGPALQCNGFYVGAHAKLTACQSYACFCDWVRTSVPCCPNTCVSRGCRCTGPRVWGASHIPRIDWSWVRCATCPPVLCMRARLSE